MKTLIKRTRFAIYILLCTVFIASCCNCESEKQSISTTEAKPVLLINEVSAGQIWVYEMDKDNPFKNTIIDTCYVIDVRGGYVQFTKNGYTRSERIRWFKTGSRRIK